MEKKTKLKEEEEKKMKMHRQISVISLLKKWGDMFDKLY